MGEPGTALRGRRVIVTRPARQSAELLGLLDEAGAVGLSLPLIEIMPPEDYSTFDVAMQRWPEFDWMILTSVNAVDAVVSRLSVLGLDSRMTAEKPLVACVGESTAQAARSAGLQVAFVPRQHSGRALAAELSLQVRNRSVLLPRSDKADQVLPQALAQNGAQVTAVVVYRNVMPRDVDGNVLESLHAGHVDAILFFSPTAVRNFMQLVGRDAVSLLQVKVCIVAIGSTTAAQLRADGIFQVSEAADTTAMAAVEALSEHFRKSQLMERVSQR